EAAAPPVKAPEIPGASAVPLPLKGENDEKTDSADSPCRLVRSGARCYSAAGENEDLQRRSESQGAQGRCVQEVPRRFPQSQAGRNSARSRGQRGNKEIDPSAGEDEKLQQPRRVAGAFRRRAQEVHESLLKGLVIPTARDSNALLSGAFSFPARCATHAY